MRRGTACTCPRRGCSIWTSTIAVPRGCLLKVAGGDRDPVGRASKGVVELHQRLQSVGLTRATIRLYPEGRHEMLNEINRDEVMADALAVLDRMIA